jgi:outer membrane protein assembly factor BamB
MESLTAADPAMAGEFRLRARLGSGGMGRVYLGYSRAGRAVAVKVVHPELSRDTEFLRRFRTEVAAARAVSGLYTAPLVATGLDDDPPWLATTFIAAPNVQETVGEGGPLPEPAIWRLGAGLAEALAAVHACGLVHRDLKPTNVLLAEDGPRLIDFGVSRALDGTVLTHSGMTIGTPPFMSPEQAEGTLVGPASDVFSFGSLLCFAACGSSPFGDGSVPTVLYRVVNEPPMLDRVPGALRGIVAGCLAKDPARRPSVDQLIELLSGDGEQQASFWPIEVELRIRDFRASLAEELRPDGVASGPTSAAAPTVTRERAVARPVPRRPRRVKRGQRDSAAPLWRVRSEPIQTTAVAAGVFYAGLRGGKVCALDTGSGKRIWRRPLPGNTARLAADDAGVYVLGDTGTYALSGAIGQTTWQRGTGAAPYPVAVRGGVVYLCEGAAVLALTAELGRPLWQSPAANVVSLTTAAGAVYATVSDGATTLVALDAATGSRAWHRILPYQNPHGLVTADDVVYVSGRAPDGWVLAIDAGTGRQLWEYLSASAPSVAAADGIAYVSTGVAEIRTYYVRSGLPGWACELPSAVTAGPTLVSGSVCVGLDSGEVYALDAANGEERWNYPLGAPVTSLTSADGIAYAIAADSSMYAFATP